MCKNMQKRFCSVVFFLGYHIYKRSAYRKLLYYSALVHVRFSGCPKSVVTAASELLIIHPFLCRNKFCNFFLWVYKVEQPKPILLRAFIVMDLWVPHRDLCIILWCTFLIECISIYVSGCVGVGVSLSHIHSLLYALLINYVTTISRLEELFVCLFVLPFVPVSLTCSLLELNSKDMLYKWRKFSPNCEEKM